MGNNDLIPGITFDRREEFVKCPECELVQKARALGFTDQTHPCSGCGHQITSEEWVTIHTRYTDAVRCPYCGIELDSVQDFVEKTVEYSSLANCALNGDTHEWKESTSVSCPTIIFYNCTKCDASKQEPKDAWDDLSDNQEELEL